MQKKKGGELKLERWLGVNLIWNVLSWISSMRLMPGFTWFCVLIASTVRRQKNGRRNIFWRTHRSVCCATKRHHINSFYTITQCIQASRDFILLTHNVPQKQRRAASDSGELLNVVDISHLEEMDVWSVSKRFIVSGGTVWKTSCSINELCWTWQRQHEACCITGTIFLEKMCRKCVDKWR